MLARSALAFVTVQNIGGNSIHPIVSIIRTEMSWSSSSNVVGTTTYSSSIIEGERSTLLKVLARSVLL